MNETSTPKFKRKSIEEKLMCEKKYVRTDLEMPFDKNLKEMMDQELLNPRELIVKRILQLSKNNLFWF